MKNNITQLLTKNNIIKILITTLFLLFPMIDILRSTYIKDIEIFNISIIEFVNFVLIGLAFILTIPKINKKKKIILSIYIIAFILYLIFHIINTYNFNTDIFMKANPDFITETYYIIRVYILPILLIIILFSNRDIFNKEYYLNILKYLIIEISGLIIVCNLLRFSYSSYDDEMSLINRTSFFDIFTYEGKAKELLTCGLFNSANQISIILFMLLPLNIYNLLNKKNIKSLILLLMQTISMIIIGTKVAAMGSVLSLVATLFAYFFFIIIKKEKINQKYLSYHLLALLITTIFIFISPFYQVMKSSISDQDNFVNEDQETIDYAYQQLEKELTDKEFVELLTEYNGVFKISSMFYRMYPIENDIDFWKTLAKRDNRLNNNYRIIKSDIIERVKVRNNNQKLDSLLGIGYTTNFMDIEKDYIYQYYLFGLIGSFLLIGIYIYFYIKNIFKLFQGKYFKYEYCLRILSSFFGLVGCYFSGHLFGWTSPMIVLATTLCIGRVNE